MKYALASHPLRRTISLQLKSHPLLAGLDDAALAELFALLSVQEGARGEKLLEQGSRDLRQYFVIEGLIKRVVTSAEGREMTLHFAGEQDMETCYEAWRQQSAPAYTIVCARRALVASLPMGDWWAFLERHPTARQVFHDRLIQLGASIVEHAVALLLLDAPSRVTHFSYRHPDLVERLPQKDVASHLNLSAETLCRLTRRTRGELQHA
jgi:CRP-like cAMP-binding protein